MSGFRKCRHDRQPSVCELCRAASAPAKKGGAPSKTELAALLERVSRLASRDPAKAAIILTSWLNQPAKPRGKKAA